MTVFDQAESSGPDSEFTGDVEFTDLALCVDNPARSYCWPGPGAIPEKYVDYCNALQAACVSKQREDDERIDYAVAHRGLVWRATFDRQAVDGDWWRLRKMPREAPSLKAGGMPSELPPGIVDVLLHSELRLGGLVLVCGGKGQGRTTTAAAIIRSRLEKFGGYAVTIEDPPETPLNGWFKGPNGVRGYCTQTTLVSRGADRWEASMHGAMRSQPAGTPSMLLISEIGSVGSASAALLAASQGFLVIATVHGLDIPSALSTVLKYVGTERCSELAGAVKVVLHQRLQMIAARTEGAPPLQRMQASVCVSPTESKVAATIRAGQLMRLGDEVQRQQNYLRNGGSVDLWAVAGAA